MPSFKAGGLEWLITLDGPKIKRCRENPGIDLGARDASQYQRLTDDVILCQDTIWQLCREQAEAKGYSEKTFQELLSGDPGEEAGNCLFEALIDFSPSHQRKLLRDLLAKNRAVQQAAMEAAEHRINQIGTLDDLKANAVAEMNAALDKALSRKMSSPSATS